MMAILRSASLGVMLLLGSACALNGEYVHDEAIIQKDIVLACLTSPIFEAADVQLSAAFPVVALPTVLVNAGVSVVCANPARFAAADASLDDWVMYRTSKTAEWVKRVLHL